MSGRPNSRCFEGRNCNEALFYDRYRDCTERFLIKAEALGFWVAVGKLQGEDRTGGLGLSVAGVL